MKQDTLHIPINTLSQTLGPNLGEADPGRQAYMDRVYGSGSWRLSDGAGLAVTGLVLSESSTQPAVVTISTDKPETRFTEAHIILETRIDYSADGRNVEPRFRYKLLGKYELAPDSISEIMIPAAVFKSQGALMVVVKQADAATSPMAMAAFDVSYSRCTRQLYVPDRQTAIRLNRKR
ncbi:MAG: hypothetical protein OEZ10_02970 [Gammaproteobacteria bacterium]|nr:hypothetical protein [Gammaproteobacteria bacterium]